MANVNFSVRALRAGKRSAFKSNDWDDLFTIITALVTSVVELKADHNAVNAKLDSDAGITDTDYASLHDTAAADPDTPVLKN